MRFHTDPWNAALVRECTKLAAATRRVTRTILRRARRRDGRKRETLWIVSRPPSRITVAIARRLRYLSCVVLLLFGLSLSRVYSVSLISLISVSPFSFSLARSCSFEWAVSLFIHFDRKRSRLRHNAQCAIAWQTATTILSLLIGASAASLDREEALKPTNLNLDARVFNCLHIEHPYINCIVKK